MDDDNICGCGGIYYPGTIALAIKGLVLSVPGLRCAQCGQEIIAAEVLRKIREERDVLIPQVYLNNDNIHPDTRTVTDSPLVPA